MLSNSIEEKANIQATSCIHGGGQMGALIRVFDWSKTSIGAISDWPATLVAIVNMMLQSPVPHVLLWGPDGILIYNDAYSVFAGARHPFLLGARVLEGWPEVADWNRNVLDKGLRGETLSYENQQLTLYRNNAPEDVWMDLNYSPILDETGTPAGVLAIVVETTQRVKAEVAVRESEERFRLLADSAPVLVAMSDAETDLTYFNKTWLEFTGRTLEEELAFGWINGVHPDDRDHALNTYLEAYKDKSGFELEYRLRRHDGEYRWMYSKVAPRFNAGGEFAGYIGSVLDIHDRKQMEEALKESEKRFKAMSDSAPVMIWMTNPDGEVVYRNDAFAKFYGLTDASSEILNWEPFVHPDDLERVKDIFYTAAKNKEPFYMPEHRLRRYNGDYRWLIAKGVPRLSPEGEFQGFIGSVLDITERKNAEDALKNSEWKFRQLVESNLLGVLFWDLDGRALEGTNRAFLDMLGFTREDLLAGKVNWAELTPPEYVAITENCVRELKETGVFLPFEKQFFRKDGSRVDVLLAGAFLEGSSEKGVCYVLDITERKRVENALRDSEARFRTMVQAVKDYAIYVTDPTGLVVDWNEGAERIFGYEREEILNKSLSHLFTEDDRRRQVAQRELQVAADKGRFETEGWRVRKDGENFWASVIVTPLYDEQGGLLGFTKVIGDMTEQLRAETDLKNSLRREQLTRRVSELSNQGLGLASILETLAREVGEFFQADRAFIIHLANEDGAYHMSTHAQYCVSSEIPPYNPVGMSPKLKDLYQRNMSQKSLLDTVRVSNLEEYREYCKDFLNSHSLSDEEREELLREMMSLNVEREKIRAILRIPVTYRNTPYGNIVLHQCLSDRFWTDEEVNFLQEVATQVGNVLYQTEIAQAEKQAKEALQKNFEQEHLIRKIVEVIGQSFDIDLILSTIADELGAYTQADRCGISRFYFEDEKLIFCASGQYSAPGIRPAEREDIELITKALQHLTPKDIQPEQEQVTNISDPDAYIEFLRKQMAPYNLPGLPTEKLIEMVQKYEVRSTLRVNIRYRGVSHGSITLSQVKYNRVWTPEEIELVKLIADHVGGAIYQAELYRQAQETAAKEQKARREIEKYTQRLEVSNRELEQFATIASHDLSEPLRKLQVFSEMLNDKVTDEGKDYLKRMNSAASRMQILMDDLLTLSRVNRKGQPFKPVDLNEIIRTVLDDMQIALQDSGAIISVEDLAIVQADESQMRQLLQNLIGNAIKYRREDIAPEVRIYGRRKGNVYETVVEDNGIGIREDHCGRIFEPFQRLHGMEKYPGTGMGLAIVKKIVERHGGTITVQSEPDQGSRFIFTLNLKPS